MDIEGQEIDFKVDSGTDVSVIGDTIYYKYFNNMLLRKTNKRLFSPCQNPLKILGVINIEIKLKGKSCKEDLFSRSASTYLGKMVKVNSVTEDNRTDYQQKYPELFNGLGCIEEEYEIKK